MFGRVQVRAAAIFAVVVAAAALVTACDRTARPSQPSVFGARVTNGKLQMWTGTRCTDVYSVAVVFLDSSRSAEVDLNMVRVSNSPVEFEHFTLGDEVPGLDVNKPLPDGFDWRTAKSMTLTVHENGSESSGSPVDLAEVITGSPSHPPDTYWFEGVGWLTPEQVATMDGTRFVSFCRPQTK